eukprot:4462758-Amphidinium_carterae.1
MVTIIGGAAGFVAAEVVAPGPLNAALAALRGRAQMPCGALQRSALQPGLGDQSRSQIAVQSSSFTWFWCRNTRQDFSSNADKHGLLDKWSQSVMARTEMCRLPGERQQTQEEQCGSNAERTPSDTHTHTLITTFFNENQSTTVRNHTRVEGR